MDTKKLESLEYIPVEEPNKILNKGLQAFLTERYRRLTPGTFVPIPEGHIMVFAGSGNDYPGVDPFSKWQWVAGMWKLRSRNWREPLVNRCPECETVSGTHMPGCSMGTVTITVQHAASLAALVEHWKELLKYIKPIKDVDRGGLSSEYCDEMD